MTSTTLTYQAKPVTNRVAPEESFRYLTCRTPPRGGTSLCQQTSRLRRTRQNAGSTRPADTRPGPRRGKTSPDLVTKFPFDDPKLPDPRRWAAQIARCSLEAIEGERPLTQLNPWVTPLQYRLLEKQRQRNQGSRSPKHGSKLSQNLGTPPQVRPVRVLSARCRATLDGAQEATVVLHDGKRGRASSMRLENQGNRWLVTALKIG